MHFLDAKLGFTDLTITAVIHAKSESRLLLDLARSESDTAAGLSEMRLTTHNLVSSLGERGSGPLDSR